jgi:hypothetical protein
LYIPKGKVPGVSTAYLYIGEAGSAFPMHVEDFNAVSANYHLCGAWKIWWGPKPKHNALFKE